MAVATRNLLRQAQAAEVAGEAERAVELLAEAARVHAAAGEVSRAKGLLRHCLRLAPGRAELKATLAALENQAPPPDGDWPGAGRGLVLPARGPVLADPAVDCWCSFCCRPKAEAGPMVAGPAGAYLCAGCAGSAARLVLPDAALPRPSAVPVVEVPGLFAAPDPPAAVAPGPTTASDAEVQAGSALEMVEAAVVLARALGWSLADVRGLGDRERRHALEVLARLDGVPVHRG